MWTPIVNTSHFTFLRLRYTLVTYCDVKTWSKHTVRPHWTLAVLSVSLTQLNSGQLQCHVMVNTPIAMHAWMSVDHINFQWEKINTLNYTNMQIINRKKLVWFNNFIWNIDFFTIKTVCKFLKSFTVPILSKIEIAIDPNGNDGPTLLFKYSKIERWIFFKLH